MINLIDYPFLKLKNYPLEDGVYYAGNVCRFKYRIEIYKVILQDGEVITERGGGYMPRDWDYWSDKVEV